jgi:hypothetical protein
VGIEFSLSGSTLLRLALVGHGRVNDRRVGLSTRMLSTGINVTSLGAYTVSLVLRCRQATSWESQQRDKFIYKIKVVVLNGEEGEAWDEEERLEAWTAG